MQPGSEASATSSATATPPGVAGRPGVAAPPRIAGRRGVAAPPDAAGRPGAAGRQHVAGPLRRAVSAGLAGTASAPGSARKMRPKLLAELILLGVGYALYTLTRDLAPARRQMAFADAAAIRTAEGWLHIAGEQQANLWLTMHPVLATMADYYYATVHFVAVIAMLVWLYWRHPALYRRARAVLVAATLAALAVCWL